MRAFHSIDIVWLKQKYYCGIDLRAIAELRVSSGLITYCGAPTLLSFVGIRTTVVPSRGGEI